MGETRAGRRRYRGGGWSGVTGRERGGGTRHLEGASSKCAFSCLSPPERYTQGPVPQAGSRAPRLIRCRVIRVIVPRVSAPLPLSLHLWILPTSEQHGHAASAQPCPVISDHLGSHLSSTPSLASRVFIYLLHRVRCFSLTAEFVVTTGRLGG